MDSQILLLGYSQDNVIQHLLEIATQFDVEFCFVDLQSFYSDGFCDIEMSNPNDAVLRLRGREIFLQDFCGIYQRVIPPIQSNEDSENWANRYSKYIALTEMLSTVPIKIINKPLSGWENLSKPLQISLLNEIGFDIPASLSTSIPEDFQEFDRHFETIYKSNSSVRSIVNLTSNKDKAQLDLISNCPVFFQEFIDGEDVRIHIVDKRLFGVRIKSDAIDYRYYRKEGSFCTYIPMQEKDIPDEISRLCLEYAKSRSITLAGFDFKINEQGVWYCLEMNPMPSYEGYDKVLDFQITQGILDFLLNENHELIHANNSI